MPTQVEPTPVDAAITQIVTTYALIAPDLDAEDVRSELRPYLDAMVRDGQSNVNVLAVAGLTRLRKQQRPTATW